MKLHQGLERETLTPQQALDFLKEGNARFISNLSANHNLLKMVSNTRDEQFPFAAVLSCSDSRVPVELVFDQGLGDVFSVRLAGNIASLKAIASIEFACRYLGSKLVVVLGHTKCGGVMGACDNVETDNLGAIFSDIRPAIALETATTENRNSQNGHFLNNVIHLNVQHQMQQILTHSDLLRGLLKEHKIGIIGGIYDLDNGVVSFSDEDQFF
jgi:carbonic anhydrase